MYTYQELLIPRHSGGHASPHLPPVWPPFSEAVAGPAGGPCSNTGQPCSSPLASRGWLARGRVPPSSGRLWWCPVVSVLPPVPGLLPWPSRPPSRGNKYDTRLRAVPYNNNKTSLLLLRLPRCFPKSRTNFWLVVNGMYNLYSRIIQFCSTYN